MSEYVMFHAAGHVPECWRCDSVLFWVAEESQPCQLWKTDLQIWERLKLPPAQSTWPADRLECPHKTQSEDTLSLHFLHIWCYLFNSCDTIVKQYIKKLYRCTVYDRCIANQNPVTFSWNKMIGRSFKGITSRICWLLFVNTTFKVGPSSPAQSADAPGGPTCFRSDNWSLRFCRDPPSHPARCYWLRATHHWPEVGWCPETCRHTLLVGHKSWLRGLVFVWVCIFF